ncbi:MAG: trigger factor, partial [Carnobacterium sp.]
EIKLGEYKNLGIKHEKATASKEEIDEEIKNIKKEMADVVVKENGEVVLGDTAIIDFDGIVDGKPLEGGKGENFPLEIGSNSFIPGFEEGLIGHKTNEEFSLKLKFPEDYVEDLKNKEVTFNVKINEIKTKVEPTVNEEFFKDLGYEDMKTEEEFIKEVKKSILEKKEKQLEDVLIDNILEKASKNLTVDINK